jgi:hypothetical protein
MIINSYIFGASYDPDAQAFITAAGITDPTQKSAINTLVVDLKGYSLWTKFKAIYPIVGGSASSHAVNLKTPGTYNLTFASGVTHSSLGMLGNGSTGYANSNFNPNLNGATLNSHHVSFYSRTNSNGTEVEFGTAAGGNQTLLEIRTSGTTYAAINSSPTYINFADTDSRGFYIANRTASNVLNVFRNSTKRVTGATASSALPGANYFILAWNNVTPQYYSLKQCAFASIGDGLTDTDVNNFAITVEKYQTTLGRSVNPWYDNGTLLLDTYSGSSYAYSLRKLRNYYIGAAIRVRRSSDNTEKDIYFNSLGTLDTSTLLSFVGLGNGFITTWYDQSGNGLDSTQTTASLQPKIVNSGSLVTNSNGKIAIDCYNYSLSNALSMPLNSTQSTFTVFQNETINNTSLYALPFMTFSAQVGNYYMGIVQSGSSSSPNSNTGSPSYYKNGSASALTSTRGALYTAFVNGSISLKSVIGGTMGASITNRYLQYTSAGAYVGNYKMSEQICWLSNQNTNKSGIESNINTYWSIY